MPYPDKQCEFCGEVQKNGNCGRHLRRKHPDRCTDKPKPSNTSARDPISCAPARCSGAESTGSAGRCSIINTDYISDATLCML